MPRISSTPKAMIWSAAKKNTIARTAKTSTMIVEIMVSRCEGQVTFAASALTCWRKMKGFVVFDCFQGTRWPGFLDDPGNREPHGPKRAARSAAMFQPYIFDAQSRFPSSTRRVSVTTT